MLLSIVIFENWLIARGIRFPFGCSIVCRRTKAAGGRSSRPGECDVKTPTVSTAAAAATSPDRSSAPVCPSAKSRSSTKKDGTARPPALSPPLDAWARWILTLALLCGVGFMAPVLLRGGPPLALDEHGTYWLAGPSNPSTPRDPEPELRERPATRSS